MNFSKGPSLNPPLLLNMQEKHRLYMCFSVVCKGGLYELNYVFGGGVAGRGLRCRISFLRSKREKEELFQAEMFPVNYHAERADVAHR